MVSVGTNTHPGIPKIPMPKDGGKSPKSGRTIVG